MKRSPFSLLFIIYLCFIGCDKKSTIHHFSGETMGTTYSIKIIDKIGQLKSQVSIKEKVDSLLIGINQHLSTYISDSEINMFNMNQSNNPFNASSELLEVVNESLKYYKLSDGSFDISVQPLVQAWGFSSEYKKMEFIDAELIDSLLLHIGLDKIWISGSSIYKDNLSLQIDASAIAKGWGVDQVSKLLNSIGMTDYMIEIGGEIFVSGRNENNDKWEIGVRFPDSNNSTLFSTLHVSNQAVATSGVYQNYYTIENVNYSHLIDPKTGYPVRHELVSATIIADECTEADAIATAVMVKGFKKGLNWINDLDGIEGLLITRGLDGAYLKESSNGFSSYE